MHYFTLGHAFSVLLMFINNGVLKSFSSLYILRKMMISPNTLLSQPFQCFSELEKVHLRQNIWLFVWKGQNWWTFHLALQSRYYHAYMQSIIYSPSNTPRITKIFSFSLPVFLLAYKVLIARTEFQSKHSSKNWNNLVASLHFKTLYTHSVFC